MDPQSWFIADSTLSSHSANISSYRLQLDLQSLAKAHSRGFLMTHIKTQTSLCTSHFHLSCTCSPSFPPFLLSVTSSSFLEVGLAHARLVALACDLGVIFGRCHLTLLSSPSYFCFNSSIIDPGSLFDCLYWLLLSSGILSPSIRLALRKSSCLLLVLYCVLAARAEFK